MRFFVMNTLNHYLVLYTYQHFPSKAHNLIVYPLAYPLGFYPFTNIKSRRSHRRCSTRKVFFKISQNSHGNTCVGASFLIKLQASNLLLLTFLRNKAVLKDIQISWVWRILFHKDSLLTLSWRRSLSYRNQSIDLLCKTIDWFLNDRDFCHGTSCKPKFDFLQGFCNVWKRLYWCCRTQHENLPVIRQKGKSQNGCYKKTNHAKFSGKRTFLTS